MSDKRKLFLKILKVELEEIENDISLLMKIYHERYEKREITHYVEQENEALLHHEVACIEKMIPELDTFSTDEYESDQAFLDSLKVFLKGFVKENQFPHAVFLLAEHKMQKVVKYIF